MNAKDYLKQVRNVKKEKEQLEAKLRETRELFTSCTTNLAGISVSSTKDPHKYDQLIILEEKLTLQINELARVTAEHLDVINEVEDTTLRALLDGYYINGKTWEQVASDLNYSWVHVVEHLHPKALKAVQQIIDDIE